MKAWELLSDINKWTVGARAKNSDGVEVPVNDKTACSFCADGAIMRCYQGLEDYYEARDKADRVAGRLFGTPIITTINDRLGYDLVMQVLKEADV